jgi:pilus assembly protein Flp/PilA
MYTLFAARTRGQGMIEYALIMLFVVLVVFGGLILLGPQMANVFGSIHNNL